MIFPETGLAPPHAAAGFATWDRLLPSEPLLSPLENQAGSEEHPDPSSQALTFHHLALEESVYLYRGVRMRKMFLIIESNQPWEFMRLVTGQGNPFLRTRQTPVWARGKRVFICTFEWRSAILCRTISISMCISELSFPWWVTRNFTIFPWWVPETSWYCSHCSHMPQLMVLHVVMEIKDPMGHN